MPTAPCPCERTACDRLKAEESRSCLMKFLRLRRNVLIVPHRTASTASPMDTEMYVMTKRPPRWTDANSMWPAMVKVR